VRILLDIAGAECAMPVHHPVTEFMRRIHATMLGRFHRVKEHEGPALYPERVRVDLSIAHVEREHADALRLHRWIMLPIDRTPIPH
jgi:hypothetical protein